ncbi:MAG: C4-dicarboxylate transporter DctA [Gammaproteobacteria bacterium]|nr:C4-dicarboxylate transporter DctA [Gammaproteobacteria bacterium]
MHILSEEPWWSRLYFQVLFAIVIGGALGYFLPEVAIQLKPLGDAFIKLIKLVIGPVIFLTVATGIAGMTSLSQLSVTTGKALAYFFVVSTSALVIGLVVANLVRPGEGMGIDPTSLDGAGVSSYVGKAQEQEMIPFLLAIIPDTFVGAFTGGQILPVLFIAVLFGLSVAGLGDSRPSILLGLHRVSESFFRMVSILMRFAPIGAFGAFAFTIGKYGIESIQNLAALVLTFYATSSIFIALVLGSIAWFSGFSLWRLLNYLKEELWLVIGTSSSEAALPSLMKKLEQVGCSKSVVGLVVPLGYSFNLDGTNIYMTLAALFIAQATGIDLSLSEQLLLLAVAIVSSKGAAGVTGSGFIILAATLAVVPSVPVAGMALILGIDRFMSECRAITNLIGNAVATIVVASWEGALDRNRLDSSLRK